MSSRTIKNTRLVYNDEKNLKIYQALPVEEFKEFFMAYLTYNVGDNIEVTDFSNPTLYGLFMQFKDKIDYNEEKWERQAAAKRENGKKGGRPKKSALQDTVGTEFNITPVTNNIPSNEEIENKPILSPQIIQDDNQYQPKAESGLNSLKMGNNGVIEDNTYMEQNIEDNNKEKDIEDMGNLLVFDETTGQYKYPSKTKEHIKEKVLKKNLPTVQVAATTQVPDEPTIPSFQEFLKETAFTLNDIIEDYRAGGMRATVQAPDRLNGLLNTKLGRFYKEEIEEYIKARVNTPVEKPAAFISDEDKYGSDVMDFIEDNQEILEALKATVDYYKYKEEDKELAAINANKKINSIVAASGKNNGNFITRLEKFCMDYSISYDESKSHSLNDIDDVA